MSDFGTSSISGMAGAMDQQTFGAAVITKTLDYMHQGQGSGRFDANYDFQTKVLAAQGLGNNVNSLV